MYKLQEYRLKSSVPRLKWPQCGPIWLKRLRLPHRGLSKTPTGRVAHGPIFRMCSATRQFQHSKSHPQGSPLGALPPRSLK